MATLRCPQRALALRMEDKGSARIVPVRSRVVVRAKDNRRLGPSGYVDADNSGRGNIFPSKQQAYMKRGGVVEGLGGGSGLGVIGGVVAVLAALVVVVGRSEGPQSLQKVADSYGGDSITVIAQRIQKSL